MDTREENYHNLYSDVTKVYSYTNLTKANIDDILDLNEFRLTFFMKLAAANGQYKVYVLLSNILQIRQIDRLFNLLSYSITSGSVKLVNFILRENTDLNMDVINGTFLEAARHNRINIVKLLLDMGANINVENQRAFTMALFNRYYKLLKILTRKKLNL
jgi:ankyrin repeat protein